MVETVTNPLLAKLRLPGRVFQLPSRGLLYKDELDSSVVDGEIHVYPMTALTEINLKNPDLLFNGKAIEIAFGECIPDIKKPTMLFGRDLDAALIFLRVATYGPDYTITVKHGCENAKNHSYVVNLEQIVSETKLLDPTLIAKARSVSVNNQDVILRPLRFVDVIKLLHKTEGKNELTVDDIKELAVMNLLNSIESVDGNNNPADIEGWIRALTTPMMNQISEGAGLLGEWGPSQIVKLPCKDCGEIMDVEIPTNPVNFFTERFSEVIIPRPSN